MHTEYVCDVCRKRFVTPEEAEKHEKRHRAPSLPVPKVKYVSVVREVGGHDSPLYPDKINVTFDDDFSRVYRKDD